MTIQEYSTLMGYEKNCSMEEYKEANLAYMMAGGMDKETFCEEYKKIGSSPLLRELAHRANDWETGYRKLKRDTEAKMQDIAQVLLRKASEVRGEGMLDTADRLDLCAEEFIGRRACVTFKLSRGLALSEVDSIYIQENLL